MVTTWAVVCYVLSFDLWLFTAVGGPGFAGFLLVVTPLNWLLITTGFSLVLYSRLHLVISSQRALRAILIVLLGVSLPIQIMCIVGQANRLGTKAFRIAVYLEIVFPVIEIALSSLYVYSYCRFVRQSPGAWDKQAVSTFLRLVLAQGFVVLGEVMLITIWYLDMLLLRVVILPLAYAVKMQVELAVLKRLAKVTQSRVDLRAITVTGITMVDAGLPQTILSLERDSVDLEGKHRDTPVSCTVFEHTGEPSRSLSRKDSFEETERRYLGRSGLESSLAC